VGALLVGVLATYAIVVSSNAKEEHWSEEKRLAAERISANEKETRRAIADSDLAKESAAKANEKAESERLERVRLEAAVAPRSLGLEEQGLIAGFWKPFSGKRVSVKTYMLDIEAAGLARQIISCLLAAGIDVDSRLASEMPFGNLAVGIHVDGSDLELVKKIRGALATVGRQWVSPLPIKEIPSMRLGSSQEEAPVAATILVAAKPTSPVR
jgi:hypothetical protein